MFTSILVAVVVVYGALVGVMYFAQRNLMYHPSRQMTLPTESGAPEWQAISVATNDGLMLTSWYLGPSESGSVLVYFHGNAGNISGRSSKVQPYIDAGFGVLLVGYRGYGANPGKPTETGLYVDAEAAIGFLADRNIGPDRWVLYGESLGTGIAVEMAALLAKKATPVGAVVLEAPFTSMGDAAAGHYPYVPARLLVRDRYDSISKINEIGTRLLIFHGDSDRVVPMALGKKLFVAADEPKSFRHFANAGHSDLYDHGAAAEVLNFLRP